MIEEVTSPRRVPVAWEALEDAFENNAANVKSYLHIETGEVLRAVDGLADPVMLQKVVADPLYLHIEPVSSRQQYRWMESFIEAIEEEPLRRKLAACIDGKGAFRRFKDALMQQPLARERWFAYRSERIQTCIQAWLKAHDIETKPREAVLERFAARAAEARAAQAPPLKLAPRPVDDGPALEAPGSDPVGVGTAAVTQEATVAAGLRAGSGLDQSTPGTGMRAEDMVLRHRLHQLVDLLRASQIPGAITYLEFLTSRASLPAAPTLPPGPLRARARPDSLTADDED